jgi:hypothetical protein
MNKNELFYFFTALRVKKATPIGGWNFTEGFKYPLLKICGQLESGKR